MSDKKVAVVVGGGQTLGEFLSHGLAKEGYRIAVGDLNLVNAQKVADDINAQFGTNTAHAFSVNACDEPSVDQFAAAVDTHFKRVDLMVYNAGAAKASPIWDFSLDNWKLNIEVNLTGYFLNARAFASLMIRDGIKGRIIQINSKSGKVGSKYNAGYSASKFGGMGLTQSLALDLADKGITVNSLMLGNLLKSPMFQSLIPEYAKKLGISEAEVEQVYIDKVPLKRGCEYQDVLDVLIFYASEKAAYCTGQSINITGGQVMF